MAIRFLIALATAMGSATLLLSVLYIGIRIFAPKTLEERIPDSARASELTPTTLIVQDFVLPRMPGLELANLLANQEPRTANVYFWSSQPFRRSPSLELIGPYEGAAPQTQAQAQEQNSPIYRINQIAATVQ